MNKLEVINKQDVLGKEFKIYGDFDNPLFLAKNVAEYIEYEGRTGQLLSTIDESEKLMHTIYASGQNREMWFLTEDGLYEVLMQSRKPIAKQFKAEVKKILKSLRTGKTKLVPMSEYQRLQMETRAENIRIRKAKFWDSLARQYDGTYKEVLHAYATKELSGEFVLPLPQISEKTYSATEIGERIGVSANKIGILANKNNLKVGKYGAWYNDKSRHSNKEVPVFRYFENVVPVLEKLLKEGN